MKCAENDGAGWQESAIFRSCFLQMGVKLAVLGLVGGGGEWL